MRKCGHKDCKKAAVWFVFSGWFDVAVCGEHLEWALNESDSWYCTVERLRSLPNNDKKEES